MPTKKAIQEFLSPYSPDVRSLALKTRALARDLLPEAEEQIDRPAKMLCYGFGPKYADSICAIMPAKNWITLGIYRGTELPDPKGLLEGSGKVHRHVKLRTEEDVESPALRCFSMRHWRLTGNDPAVAGNGNQAPSSFIAAQVEGHERVLHAHE